LYLKCHISHIYFKIYSYYIWVQSLLKEPLYTLPYSSILYSGASFWIPGAYAQYIRCNSFIKHINNNYITILHEMNQNTQPGMSCFITSIEGCLKTKYVKETETYMHNLSRCWPNCMCELEATVQGLCSTRL
jgi:hypothetical protein